MCGAMASMLIAAAETANPDGSLKAGSAGQRRKEKPTMADVAHMVCMWP